MELLLIIGWLVCGIVAGVIAAKPDPIQPTEFAAAVLLGPFGLAARICRPRGESYGLDYKAVQTCPGCSTLVEADARKCGNCGSDLEPVGVQFLG